MGTAGVARSIESQNFMAAKLKVNFFVFRLRVTLFRHSITDHVIDVKHRANFVDITSFCHGKESFGFKKLVARLDTCFRL